jgi:hypothetical protein
MEEKELTWSRASPPRITLASHSLLTLALVGRSLPILTLTEDGEGGSAARRRRGEAGGIEKEEEGVVEEEVAAAGMMASALALLLPLLRVAVEWEMTKAVLLPPPVPPEPPLGSFSSASKIAAPDLTDGGSGQGRRGSGVEAEGRAERALAAAGAPWLLLEDALTAGTRGREEEEGLDDMTTEEAKDSVA